jgi:hypothetical protein
LVHITLDWGCLSATDDIIARYGTVLAQWYVMHSYERHLPWSMIDDKFEVCFKLLLSIVLEKPRM